MMTYKYTFFLVVTVLVFSFFIAVPASNAQNAPTFGALGPCPSCETPSQPPVQGGNTAPPANTTTNSTYNSIPGAPNAPCDPATSPEKRKSKHKKHNGAISGMMSELLELLVKFFQLLLQLLGGGTINQNQNAIPQDTDTNQPPQDDEQNNDEGNDDGDDAVEDPLPCPPTDDSANTPVSQTPQPSTAAPSSAMPAPSNAAISGAPQGVDLSTWKLTLPSGETGKPREILQPQLNTFSEPPVFIKENGSIRFRAPVNGVTTSGSSYPRSELREMSNNGATNAAWSSSTGTHTMTIEEAIIATPKTKKHVVAGQIHDSEDDVIVIRLEDKKLFVDIGGTEGPTLDANYTLGKKFTVKFEVTGGKTNIYYNGGTTPAHSISTSYSGAYFKAGAYTQSNCTTDSADCSANNYGEVVIYSLKVTHQ